MYVRAWKKGNKLFASVVKSVRIGNKVRQETVAYLGEITEDQLPYLKAAYAKKKPRLVYDDEMGENE
ncbi:MAG: 2-C-methyl-D-erythritol 4-phosphate cytidylyltransferase [Bacillota bacterium]|nr:2-C-methyl-D-erythritol 4-phosphate cytidylyltransferase [Bacillota bacterium]